MTLLTSVDLQPSAAGANQLEGRASVWQATCDRFVRAVSPAQRPHVLPLLHQIHGGGSGLRDWVAAIAWRGAYLPERIPVRVIDVYLADSEAVPLYDCEGCGLAVPVRPSRLYGMDGEPDEVYFTNCPICGGRTGYFLHFAKTYERRVSDELRRGRPR
jgi:hypothetical protein